MEPFEHEALLQLLLNIRAMASMLGVEDGHGRKLAIYAEIVETWMEKHKHEWES